MIRTVDYSELSDSELLAQTATDPEAFGAFYDRFESSVLGFFYRATRRGDLAADLTAEVFAAALASSASFHPGLGAARAWLFGIARHELADLWERGRVEDRGRRRLGMEPLGLSDELIERIEQLGDERGANPLEMLETLPADQRAAIEGRVIHERDYAELAAALSCSGPPSARPRSPITVPTTCARAAAGGNRAPAHSPHWWRVRLRSGSW